MASRTTEVTRLVWHLELWRSLGGICKTLGGESLWRWSCCSISLISAKKDFLCPRTKNFWHLKNLVKREVDMVPQRKFQNLVSEEEELSSGHSAPTGVHFGTDSLLLSVRTYLCSCHQLCVKPCRMEALMGRFIVLWCSWAPDHTIFCESSVSVFRTSQSSLSMTMACPVINWGSLFLPQRKWFSDILRVTNVLPRVKKSSFIDHPLIHLLGFPWFLKKVCACTICYSTCVKGRGPLPGVDTLLLPCWNRILLKFLQYFVLQSHRSLNS